MIGPSLDLWSIQRSNHAYFSKKRFLLCFWKVMAQLLIQYRVELRLFRANSKHYDMLGFLVLLRLAENSLLNSFHFSGLAEFWINQRWLSFAIRFDGHWTNQHTYSSYWAPFHHGCPYSKTFYYPLFSQAKNQFYLYITDFLYLP